MTFKCLLSTLGKVLSYSLLHTHTSSYIYILICIFIGLTDAGFDAVTCLPSGPYIFSVVRIELDLGWTLLLYLIARLPLGTSKQTPKQNKHRVNLPRLLDVQPLLRCTPSCSTRCSHLLPLLHLRCHEQQIQGPGSQFTYSQVLICNFAEDDKVPIRAVEIRQVTCHRP